MQHKAAWHNSLILGLGVVVVALDQWTKSWVRANLPEGTSLDAPAWLSPYATITHTYNTGVAFGMFQNKGNLFAYVTVAVVLAIVLYYRRLATSNWLLSVALGLQLGGAIGNLIDRVARGYVTDFVNVRFFAVFNVADSALVVGAILLGIYALFLEGSKPAPVAPSPTTDAPGADGPASVAP